MFTVGAPKKDKVRTILVCGGRRYDNKDKLWAVLDKLVNTSRRNPLGDHVRIIHGGAPGADALADQWAVCNWKEMQMFVADWKLGPFAGNIRNQRMLDEGKPDLVVAFPGGRGTADMVRRARLAGVEVLEVE